MNMLSITRRLHPMVSMLFILFIALTSCSSGDQSKEPTKYSYDIGDIVFDPAHDNDQFILCDKTRVIHRRNGLYYSSGNHKLEEHIKESFSDVNKYANYSGFLMIRFALNCHLEIDRIRLAGMNYDFSTKEAPDALKSDALSMIRTMDKWSVRNDVDKGRDFTKYLNLKFTDGKFVKVLQ